MEEKKKNNWGGKRKGAGRKKGENPPRKTRAFKLNDEEYKAVKEYIDIIRTIADKK